MSSVRNPVGPQPPSVYWRRRLLVLIGLIAVVVIIVLIIVRPGADNTGAATPTPTNSASSTPVAGEAGDPCNPAVIQLEPITDSVSYASGVQPQISMSITNTGSVACTLDVGTSEQVYFIVSGSDPIWNSRDCQQGGTPLEMELEPNTPITTTPFAWDRTRSAPDTCATGRPEVIAGGATYRLSVALGSIESAEDTPFILN
ncbi:hypothetical protein [Pseudolysinimonas sp.]|uniref:hypothetical protein n=1 Tax=Pseudolysinimonas sp. TaxID=2680009 RepID=UPI00286C9B3F|nr:hypothetical protein [Pseudolysinimonas sp.]